MPAQIFLNTLMNGFSPSVPTESRSIPSIATGHQSCLGENRGDVILAGGGGCRGSVRTFVDCFSLLHLVSAYEEARCVLLDLGPHS